MTDTPENNLNTTSSAEPTPPKSSGLGSKLALALLVVLAGTGAAGYLAYQRGLANQYLPEVLQKKTPTDVLIAPTDAPPSSTTSTDNAHSDNNTASATPNANEAAANTTTSSNGTTTAAADNHTTANPPAATPDSTHQPTQPTPADADKPASVATVPPAADPNAHAPAASATPAPVAPVAPILNNAATAALLTTLDAQNQWQTLQTDFNQNWDTAAALQQIQMLKNQLQATNNSALLPSISALTQVEGQIQAWNAVNPKAHLDAMQQAMTDLNKLHIRTTEDVEKAEQAAIPDGWWNRFIATLKQVFAVKRVNTAEVHSVDVANAAIVKQGINANLVSALWAAHNGQWGNAQEQVRQANEAIQKYGEGYTLDALKPMMDMSGWPTKPDFNVVQQALMQARAQLNAQMQSQLPASTLPAKPNTPNNNANPNVTPNATPNATNKGATL